MFIFSTETGVMSVFILIFFAFRFVLFSRTGSLMSSTIESDRAAKKLQQFCPWRSLSFECVNGLTSESHRAGDEM